MNRVPDLIRAAYDGDLLRINQLLDQKVDIDAVDDDNYWNALHTAIEHDRVEVVRLLIQRGADIERVVQGCTPLSHAVDASADAVNQTGGKAEDHRTAVILMLLAAGADIESGLVTAQQYHCETLINLLSEYQHIRRPPP